MPIDCCDSSCRAADSRWWRWLYLLVLRYQGWRICVGELLLASAEWWDYKFHHDRDHLLRFIDIPPLMPHVEMEIKWNFIDSLAQLLCLSLNVSLLFFLLFVLCYHTWSSYDDGKKASTSENGLGSFDCSRFFFFSVSLMPAINARIHRYVSLAVYLCHLKYEKRLKVGRNMQDDDERREEASESEKGKLHFRCDKELNFKCYFSFSFSRESLARCQANWIWKHLNSTIPFFMCLAASNAWSWVAKLSCCLAAQISRKIGFILSTALALLLSDAYEREHFMN